MRFFAEGAQSSGSVQSAVRGNEEVKYFGDLWREQEENAIYIGLDLDTFWNLTPAEFQKYVNVYEKKQKERMQEKDLFNYMLAKYITIGYHDPKKFPKPFIYKKETKRMSGEEMEAQARLITLQMGGKVNGNIR